MSETIATLVNLLTLTFVVTSMFTFGLRLTLRQIIEPLRNWRLVGVALLLNFVIVPLLAFLLARVFSLEQNLTIGLLLMSSAAGAAMIPKLAEIAHGNLRVGVSLVALLVIGSLIFMPLALPLMLPGVTVNVGSIASTLGLQVLLPLGLGILLDSLYEEASQLLVPVLAPIANISLALMLVLMLGQNISGVISLIGTGAIISIVLLLALAMAAGYLLGGPDEPTRRVISLSTAQRNLAAAFAVAAANFADRPNVLLFLAAAGLLAMIVVFPVAAQMGQRSRDQAAARGEVVQVRGAPVPVTGSEGDDEGEPSIRR
ncbi:MAG TPA: bile acid:sodium symporter [Anaerolineaceae bacterium]|nr:bile acid:sodium symporter [Anaerolineaceae bacterium]